MAAYAAILFSAIRFALAFLFTFFLFRAMLRRQWLATAIFALLFVLSSLAGDYPLIQGSASIVVGVLALWTLIRYGVLPMVIAIFVSWVSVLKSPYKSGDEDTVVNRLHVEGLIEIAEIDCILPEQLRLLA